MASYKEMYYKLFRSQTKAIELLKAAQLEAEAMFIDADLAEVTHLKLLKEEDELQPDETE